MRASRTKRLRRALDRLNPMATLYCAGDPAGVSELTGRAAGCMLTLDLGDTLDGQDIFYFAGAQKELPERSVSPAL